MGGCCSRRAHEEEPAQEQAEQEQAAQAAEEMEHSPMSPVPSWGRSMLRAADRRKAFGVDSQSMEID